jgi:RNA polymerase sigma-70 factor (ECF subfamily)
VIRVGSREEGIDGTDGAIVRAVLAGDTEQYAVLVHRHRDRYARYAARMLGSLDAAEDAVQDAFVRAYQHLAQCRDPERFAGWFFLILRNRCFAERRRRRWTARLIDERGEAIAAPDRSDRATEDADARRALQRALQALTPEQREVFVLKHVEGLPYEAIAERTGATLASLKMRMHRAYDRLREQLKEHL